MAFKPKTPTGGGGGGTFEDTSKFPVPRAGLRKGRVSLIVDMGEQEREDFEDPKTKEVKALKPCDQVAVFVDLVADTVDYGGSIGRQHYRLAVNNTFKGDFKGINFLAVPQKDADGNILKDKDGKWLPYVLHPASPLTKLAKAADRPDIIKSMDIEQLLDDGAGLPVMIDVEVKVTDHKDGKKDADGNLIQYKNVNFKGAAKVPEDDDGNPLTVAPLNTPAKLISFDNATKEDIKFIRAPLLKKIKLALNYAGSQMQKAIEAYEAEKGGDDDGDDAPAPAPAPKPAAKTTKKAAPAPAPKPSTSFDDMDDDVPF